ncbi:MAG: hypothetical protein ACP5UR_11890, partial [Chloroflexus sp.]|uniref:hypothetical protein n=1 Tax=Chloroflexus sp. TaxID=1904827 RepID=UPI003D096D9C
LRRTLHVRGALALLLRRTLHVLGALALPLRRTLRVLGALALPHFAFAQRNAIRVMRLWYDELQP